MHASPFFFFFFCFFVFVFAKAYNVNPKKKREKKSEKNILLDGRSRPNVKACSLPGFKRFETFLSTFLYCLRLFQISDKKKSKKSASISCEKYAANN